MNTFNIRIVLQLFVLIIVLVSGGYVIFEKYKTGWDQAKYEEYSMYYDALLFKYDAVKLNQSAIKNIQTKGYLTITKGKTVEEWLIDIPKDKSEFEKTWYMVFFYFQKVELENKRMVCTLMDGEGKGCVRYKGGGDKKIKDEYLQKAAEYRQKIEEMKPK